MKRKVSVTPDATPWLKIGKKKQRHYKGITMKTDEGVHEQILDLLGPYLSAGDTVKVLDWGCGAGALSQRLMDHGCTLLSIDKSADDFQARTEFMPVDFDDPVALSRFIQGHRESFDIVVASEVIEHVRNPWDFMIGIRQVLKEKGVVLVSTPNVAHMMSRLVFLLKGNLFGFEESDLSYGHITPISMLKMNVIARDTGWQICSWAEGGALPLIWLTTSPKHLIYTIVSIFLRPCLQGTISGWCLLFVMKKSS